MAIGTKIFSGTSSSTKAELSKNAETLRSIELLNKEVAVSYFQVFNLPSASVTVGTTAPVLTFPVAAGQSGHVEYSHGIPFSTALSAAVTTGVADNDTGAPGANDFVLNAFYK